MWIGAIDQGTISSRALTIDTDGQQQVVHSVSPPNSGQDRTMESNTEEPRETQRKLCILHCAEKIGHVA
jgi:glycerol kinase